jgi:hypothetical protein
MNELVSETVFRWILTSLVGGLATSWLVYDSINLIRTRNADRSDPIVSDKRFGYMIGIAIGIIGVIGSLTYHGVF